ncbi:MAG: exodeoxyribonuclease VII small subunit [Perlucidibaca sp.]
MTTTPATSNDSPLDFERALAELEQQVHRLEGGELSLEDALQAFESGVRLTRQCQQALDQAEQKVQLLLARADGGVDNQAFTPAEDA